MRLILLLALLAAPACSGESETLGGADAGGPLDAGAPVPDAAPIADGGESADAGAGSDAAVEADGGVETDAGAELDAGEPAPTLKPLPSGVFESTAGVRQPDADVVGDRTPGPLAGVMIKVAWNLCERDCLLDTIERQLDAAHARGLAASLIVGDALYTPASILARCERFDYTFRGAAAQMCLPWDPVYQAEKADLLEAMGARFDAHPALAYVYFTGACATNGSEGHCRVDEAAFTAAGYTESRLIDAYVAIMGAQRAAFPTTPIAFEVHAIFGGSEPWASLWRHVRDSGRVGVAAWWCSERLSMSGAETAPVWDIVQAAAQASFTVCQTVGNFTSQPYRFSDAQLGLDYGTEGDFDAADSLRAFEDTMSWASGTRSHAGQGAIAPFSVIEPWTQDVRNSAFSAGW